MSGSIARVPLTNAAALLYLLAQVLIGVRAGDPTDLWWWLGEVLFLGWCVSPIWAGLWLARRLPGSIPFGGCFLGVLAIAVIGFAEEWYVLFVGPSDAQNALIMIFAPLLQWVAVGIAVTLAWMTGRYVFKSS